MYVIRRIAKAQPGKVWQVANLLIKICAAYEENGRPKAQVYVSQDLPGTPNVAYADVDPGDHRAQLAFPRSPRCSVRNASPARCWTGSPTTSISWR